MRSYLLTLTLIACILFTNAVQAQLHRIDSTTFTFSSTDSLVRTGNLDGHSGGSLDTPQLVIDTTGAQLWQLGHTTKPLFATDTLGSYGLMTDTTNPYPANANNGFTLKMIIPPSNPIIEFWHEYQTHAGHAGGTIEFSTDSGSTWVNVITCFGITTQNVYGSTDTLNNGIPAFSGTSNGQVFSSLQFINCEGIKTTSTNCFFVDMNLNIFLRFRFLSDSLTDSLSGWKIDSIRVVSTDCEGAVPLVKKLNTLNVFPNPAFDGVFNFPALDNAASYMLNIYDSRGSRVVATPYTSHVDLGAYPAGLYFYSVTNGSNYYSGKLQTE